MSERETLFEYVYLGITVPKPDYPPRAEKVEKVFVNEVDAVSWSADRPPLNSNSGYRRIEKHEVVR